MEPISAASAVVGLVGTVATVGKALHDCIRTMRLADRDAYLTQTELTTLGHLLMHFEQLVSSHDSQGAQLNEQTDLQEPVISQGKNLIHEMEHVLKKIGMLDEGDLQTRGQRWLSRFRWYMRKKEVLQLCVQFNQVKVSVMAFVSMVGLESVREELRKVRDELKKLCREQLPGSKGRIARLRQIRKELERRVEAFNLEVEAARASCKMAALEVRQQSPLPETLDLSIELDRRVRRVSKIVINNESENALRRRHRHSTSRRTSGRSPPANGRPTRRPPPGPTSPSSGSTMVMIPSNSPPPPPPAPAAVYHPDQSLQREEEIDQSSEEGIIAPLVTRDPRYFRDFRNEPFPDRQELPREHPADSGENESREPVESPTEPPHGQGTYVNPENPQDRIRMLPNGRLSEG